MNTVFDKEIIGAMASGIVDDMQAGLFRSGYSSIIRESHDASCAVLLRDGSLAAQKVVLPIHVGAFPAVVKGILNKFNVDLIRPGDCFVCNSPWEGGSPHSPDFAVAVPVFFDDELVAFTSSIAHKSDIGGSVPGSCPANAKDLFSEGLHVPPVRLYCQGEPNSDVVSFISGNSRSPLVVLGDLMGQAGVCFQGADRVEDLFVRFGNEAVFGSFESLRTKSLYLIRERLLEIPDFKDSAFRLMDHDGINLDKPLAIRVVVEKKGPNITFDFSDTDSQGIGPINIRPHLLDAACAYVMVSITNPSLSINQGVLDSFQTITKKGTVVDPEFPAPVNSYNTALHAIIEAIFATFGQYVPRLARADGGGGRALTFAHSLEGKTLIQYELFAGGTGAMLDYDGEVGCHCNQTNGKVGSIEMLETEFPVQVNEFSVRRGSGGEGMHKGGCGFRRKYTVMNGSATITLRSSKHDISPQGSNGGEEGATGFCQIDTEAGPQVLATMESGLVLRPGDTLMIDTPGGGGFGQT